MKKILLLATILTVAFYSQAQDDAKKKKKYSPRFSVVGGLNFSGIAGESDSYSKLQLGGLGGLRFNLVDLSDNLALRTGLEFSMQGSGYDGVGGFDNGHVRLNYINVPIVASFQSEGGFYAEGGLQPGFLISAKDKYGDMTEDIKDYYNKVDVGLLLGGGYRVSDNISIGVQLSYGLLNVNRKMDGSNDPPKDHNLVIGLRGQYSF